MNAFIHQLLEEIRTGHCKVRDESLLKLWMLLERNFSRNRKDPLHGEVLSKELLALALGEKDLMDIVNRVEALVFDEQIPLQQRAALVGIIGKLPRTAVLAMALRFLARYGSALDDESVHSVVANLCFCGVEEAETAGTLAMLEEHHTEAVLRQLLLRNSEQLKVPIVMALRHMYELRHRLNPSDPEPVQAIAQLPEVGRAPSWGEMDTSTQLLALRMRLVSAVSNYAERCGLPHGMIAPWECEDPAVRECWESFAAPGYLQELQEWLEAEKATGADTKLTEEAIKHARQKSAS